jgi:transcriptional regulator with XRE-family HTH domain
MPSAFQHLLRQHLAERAADNARAVALRVGMAPTYLYRVISGNRPPPIRFLAGIADALRLTGGDRYAFIAVAIAAHLPADAREALRAAQVRHRRHDVDVTGGSTEALANPPAPRRRGRRPAVRPLRPRSRPAVE